MKITYKLNYILEIFLFSLSVFIIEWLKSEKLYLWAIFAMMLAILLEIFIKNKEYNPLIKLAGEREQKNRELEDNGIINHYFMDNYESKNKRNSNIEKAIDEANEMFLLAETGKSYLDIPTDRHWRNIKDRLNNGIPIKVLLINPFCMNKQVRNNFNNTKGIDRKLDIESLTSLNNKYENLEIRFTEQVYCSLFFTDKYMIYDPYHLGKISDRIENNFIAIEFERENRNYNILKSHFNNCWKLSQSFEEVIDR
ncbi:hypothetical protein ACPWSR_03045 [Alloiococcus sp. CFN-8]|uniref:hypothetical protein n=1 Tax=Alloiococcus sp. CFN-8 TaxID=3416081 RepID=UPI003CED63E6